MISDANFFSFLFFMELVSTNDQSTTNFAVWRKWGSCSL